MRAYTSTRTSIALQVRIWSCTFFSAHVMSLEGLLHADRCLHLYGPGGCSLTKPIIAYDGRMVARLQILPGLTYFSESGIYFSDHPEQQATPRELNAMQKILFVLPATFRLGLRPVTLSLFFDR